MKVFRWFGPVLAFIGTVARIAANPDVRSCAFRCPPGACDVHVDPAVSGPLTGDWGHELAQAAGLD
jgi:hypothetical protein